MPISTFSKVFCVGGVQGPPIHKWENKKQTMKLQFESQMKYLIADIIEYFIWPERNFVEELIIRIFFPILGFLVSELKHQLFVQL